MATASNSLKLEHKRKAWGHRDKFAARLAKIVLRWRTVQMQQPHSASAGLWMSRTPRGEPKAARP
jgi:hypothetical protein